MKKSTLALAVAVGVMAQQAGAAGFIEDSKASVSSRTMYFDNDNREGDEDQREAATGLKFDYKSGFTQGVVGFGIDAQAMVGLHLDGGKGQRPDANNSFSPSDSDGSAEHSWSRGSANVKALFSKTEAHLGGALQPNLPILVANDGRLLPQTFEGGTITSKVCGSRQRDVQRRPTGARRGPCRYQQHRPGRERRYRGQQPVPLCRC